jgi:hypothetical protein
MARLLLYRFGRATILFCKYFSSFFFYVLISFLYLSFVKRYDTLIPYNTSRVENVGSKSVCFNNNENIRETVLKTMRSTLVHLMTVCEDDTKSLCLLIKVRLKA